MLDSGRNNWWFDCKKHITRFYLRYIDGEGTWMNRMVVTKTVQCCIKVYYLARRRNRLGHREWIGGATANFCIWNYMLMMVWVPVGSLWSLEKPSGVSARNSHSMKTSAPVDLVFPTIWITYVQKCVYNKCKKSRNFRYDQMNDICWYRYVFSM